MSDIFFDFVGICQKYILILRNTTGWCFATTAGGSFSKPDHYPHFTNKTMSTIFEKIDIRKVGYELQKIRKRLGMTQGEVAASLNLARTSIVAVEKGERALKPDELMLLSQKLGIHLNDILRPRPQFESFDIQFRSFLRADNHDTEIQKALYTFEELIRNYVELETITGQALSHRYPKEAEHKNLPYELAAEQLADNERSRLGLGSAPVASVGLLLEEAVGMRIFYIPMPNGYSEIYHYNSIAGGCLAVNAHHPLPRRNYSLAHGYAHFLAHREQSYTFNADSATQYKSAAEKFADAFACHFLMPRNGILRHFFDMVQNHNGAFSVTDLCLMADYFGVSAQAMALRLEMLGKFKPGIWDDIKRAGVKIRSVQADAGIEYAPTPPEMLPKRYRLLAAKALENGDITETQFARFLGVGIVEARALRQQLDEDQELNADE